MEIFKVLQILCLMHDVNHGFYIILPQIGELWAHEYCGKDHVLRAGCTRISCP